MKSIGRVMQGIVIAVLVLASLGAGFQPAKAATTLATGDLAILGMNADDPDEFAFVLLVDITADTVIKFTDNGWTAGHTFRTGEGFYSWTAPTDLPAGTVIDLTTVTPMMFATGGDQILAYQGPEAVPTFIYAVNDNGVGWQTDATNSNTSALPTGLVNGVTAVAINHIDNFAYNGTTSGTQAALLASISSPAHYTTNDAVHVSMPTGPFSVVTELAPAVTSTAPAENEQRVAVDANITLEFSEPVNAAADWFTITCSSSGVHSAVLAEALPSATLTLNPDADFSTPESCTVTIHAANITDADFEDPPDTMAEDYAFTFYTYNVSPYVVSTSPAANEVGVLPAAAITVTFNEAVNASAGFYSVTCTESGLHTAAVSALPAQSVTLTPDQPFTVGEACTITLYAAAITDTDATLPAHMDADYAWTFTILVEGGVRIHDIQGAAHTSPYVGQVVTRVPGIVTARTSTGFYMQDIYPDADPATSEGVFVYTGSAPAVLAGDSLLVTGTVTEYRPGGISGGGLTVTEIGSGPTILVVGYSPLIPPAALIAAGNRLPPTQVIEPGPACNLESTCVFDAAAHGIDFYESLEGMRVQIDGAVAVSGTNAYGELAVVSGAPGHAGLRTPEGGVILTPGDFNPERIILDDVILAVPIVNTGTVFTGPILGVMDYNFGNYKLQITDSLSYTPASFTRSVAAVPQDGQLTVASYNVENLAPTDLARMATIAGYVVNNLRSPDILGLEEIQDNSGATDDGVVSASQTLANLIAAIDAAGGPTYAYRQIDPVNNADGGAPGGNIRVALLYRPDRVTFMDRGFSGPELATQAVSVDGELQVTNSPGRIDPTNPAFTDSRKPLVGEFLFNGRKVFVIVNHLKSKGGDDPLFGFTQPPVFSSESGRIQQAAAVNAFVDSLLAVDPAANVIVLGDMNDFWFSQTLLTLEGAGSEQALTTLYHLLPPEEIYSYIYDGNSQALDHILVSSHMLDLDSTVEFEVIHVNSVFASAEQISDHDALLARIWLVYRTLLPVIFRPLE